MKQKITLECAHCNKSFRKLKNLHTWCTTHTNQKEFFCCPRCANLHAIRSQTVTCKQCSKSFIKRLSEIKSYPNHFCSHSCSATFSNKTRLKTRRSKCEIALFEMLVKEFPNLDILPNDKTMLEGYEVDIAIPQLKLAIEWNGIVHFKPIYGQEKLNKIQNRDQEKLLLATNKNINLIIISDHSSTMSRVNEAFEQIKSIIKQL